MSDHLTNEEWLDRAKANIEGMAAAVDKLRIENAELRAALDDAKEFIDDMACTYSLPDHESFGWRWESGEGAYRLGGSTS